MGGHYLIAKDFVGPDVEPDEVRQQVRERRKLLLYGWPKALAGLRLRRQQTVSFLEGDFEEQSRTIEYNNAEKSKVLPSLRPRSNKYVSFIQDDRELDATTAVPTEGVTTPANFASPAGTITAHDLEHETREQEKSDPSPNSHSEDPTPLLTTSQRRRKRFISQLKTVIKSTLTPCSLSMIISIPIALVPSLKGLFTETANSRIPNAPDGEPPLAFILDFATFMGAASVPLGLMCLGSALARLNFPRSEWPNLPIGAILSLAVLKTVVQPVIGVLLTIGLTTVGVISKEDKVLQFVCM